jgi:hypothetical protein
VNKKTGEDYTWFFNQYLYNRFTPVLEYYMKENRLYMRWTYTNEDFRMTIAAHINGETEETVLSPCNRILEYKFGEDLRTLSLTEDLQLYGIKENSHLEKLYKRENPHPGSEMNLPK